MCYICLVRLGVAHSGVVLDGFWDYGVDDKGAFVVHDGLVVST